jgi:hypothetical protein
LRASIHAPVDVVFDVLTDHEGKADVTAFRSSTLDRIGDPPPNRVGPIRTLTLIGRPISLVALVRPAINMLLRGVMKKAEIRLRVARAGRCFWRRTEPASADRTSWYPLLAAVRDRSVPPRARSSMMWMHESPLRAAERDHEPNGGRSHGLSHRVEY